MAKSQTVLQRKDTTSNSALYISFDLGDKNWQLSLGDDRFHVSRHTVAAGDTAAVASLILKAATRFKISGRSEVYSVYEAGRDGSMALRARRRQYRRGSREHRSQPPSTTGQD